MRPRRLAHDSDSTPQREAEEVIRELFGREIQVQLEPRRFYVGNGKRAQTVDVDAYGTGRDGTILAEIYARQGTPKSAHLSKLMEDATRLSLVRRRCEPSAKLYLVVADHLVSDALERTWRHFALRVLRVGFHVVNIDDDLRNSLSRAQRRQARGNRIAGS